MPLTLTDDTTGSRYEAAYAANDIVFNAGTKQDWPRYNEIAFYLTHVQVINPASLLSGIGTTLQWRYISAIASQIIGKSSTSTACLRWQQHHWPFVTRWLADSPHKGPVTWKAFTCDDELLIQNFTAMVASHGDWRVVSPPLMNGIGAANTWSSLFTRDPQLGHVLVTLKQLHGSSYYIRGHLIEL